MIAAFRTELVKQVLRLRTFVVLAIVVLIPVIMTIANKANPPGGGERGRAVCPATSRSLARRSSGAAG